MTSSEGLTYRDAGVNIETANKALAKAKSAILQTQGPECVGGIGGFGGLFRLPPGLEKPLLCASTDSVGTKLQVAAMVGRFDSVGRCLVNHCVNDILVQGARPWFLLDYVAASTLSDDHVADLIRGFAEACVDNGAALLGGETAEMPGTYCEGEYDLVASVIGVVEEDALYPRPGIVAGDVLVGLRSSGLHTNGFSLARKALFEIGGLTVEDRPEELGGVSVGDALLAVHRTYAPLLLPLLPLGHIKAMAHLTGGGFVDNIPRVLPDDVSAEVDSSAWEPLPIFQLIRKLGKVPAAECYRAFNMGIGMVLVAAPERVEPLLAALAAAGEEGAVVLGKLVPGDGTTTVR